MANLMFCLLVWGVVASVLAWEYRAKCQAAQRDATEWNRLHKLRWTENMTLSGECARLTCELAKLQTVRGQMAAVEQGMAARDELAKPVKVRSAAEARRLAEEVMGEVGI